VPYSRDYKRKYEFFRKKLKKQVSNEQQPSTRLRNACPQTKEAWVTGKRNYISLTSFENVEGLSDYKYICEAAA